MTSIVNLEEFEKLASCVRRAKEFLHHPTPPRSVTVRAEFFLKIGAWIAVAVTPFGTPLG